MTNYFVFISGDIFVNLNEEKKGWFSEQLKKFKNIGFWFITNDSEKRLEIGKYDLIAVERGKYINSIAKESLSVLFLGCKLYDFTTANNNNMFLVYLSEYKGKYNINEKVLDYGFEVDFEEFFKILKLINESAGLYLDADLNKVSNFRLMSLINARYYSQYTLSDEEREVAMEFEDLLKKNNLSYKKIFVSFIIIMILKNINIKNFNNCFYYPTSRGNGGINELMEEICQRIRILIGNSVRVRQDNLFYRKKQIEKSRKLSFEQRFSIQRHIESINLQKSERIDGKKIIILDDYMTNGTSSETVRELLKNTGANNILFLTIGHFGNPYMKFCGSTGEYNKASNYIKENLKFNQENSHFNLEKLFEILHK